MVGCLSRSGGCPQQHLEATCRMYVLVVCRFVRGVGSPTCPFDPVSPRNTSPRQFAGHVLFDGGVLRSRVGVLQNNIPYATCRVILCGPECSLGWVGWLRHPLDHLFMVGCLSFAGLVRKTFPRQLAESARLRGHGRARGCPPTHPVGNLPKSYLCRGTMGARSPKHLIGNLLHVLFGARPSPGVSPKKQHCGDTPKVFFWGGGGAGRTSPRQLAECIFLRARGRVRKGVQKISSAIGRRFN
jgi:hypothetical protein